MNCIDNQCGGCSGGYSYQSKTTYGAQEEDEENKYGAKQTQY